MYVHNYSTKDEDNNGFMARSVFATV